MHDAQIAELGGRYGIKDIWVPRDLTGWRDEIRYYQNHVDAGAPVSREKVVAFWAAHYLCGICRRRPFVSGNRRTAFLAAAVFLNMNGYDLAFTNAEVVDVMRLVHSRKLSLGGVQWWLRQRLRVRAADS